MRKASDGLQWLRALQLAALRERVDHLETMLKANPNDAAQRERAAEKIERGASLTPEEVAAFLGVSKRTIRRLELDDALTRCRALRGAVRYPARDVLRLASAPGKER